jgi:hypothetical protein
MMFLTNKTIFLIKLNMIFYIWIYKFMKKLLFIILI